MSGETLEWNVTETPTDYSLLVKTTSTISITSDTIDDYDYYATMKDGNGSTTFERGKLVLYDMGPGIKIMYGFVSGTEEVGIAFMAPTADAMTVTDNSFLLNPELSFPCTVTLEIIPKGGNT